MKNTIEAGLGNAVTRATTGAPPRLAGAIRHAVFPGGARVRPRLCLAVAEACGNDQPALSEASACSLELLHCASLVHDDLPCFDDADARRGAPSVHCVYGEPLAVLVGDALIVLAFETLARAGAVAPERLPGLMTMVAQSVGSPNGLVAGQAWEAEPSVPLEVYHRAKTGSLFMAATMSGALAAGHEPASWRRMGERIGSAYQVADDLLDALASRDEAGKPVRQDTALIRPNAVEMLGAAGAVARLRELVGEAIEAVPPCQGAESLRALVVQIAERLVPAGLKQTAA